MAAKPAKLGDVAVDLARRWATQRLAAVQSYGRILADYGEGRSSSRAAVGALVKLAAEEAVRYPSDAVALAADYAAAAARRVGVDLGAETSETLGDRSASPIRDLSLTGVLGGEALGEFFLKNPHGREVSVSFAASDFEGPGGEIDAKVALEPEAFVLEADEERRVRLSVFLDPKRFAAGHRYGASVAIVGFNDMLLRIRLAVLKPD